MTAEVISSDGVKYEFTAVFSENGKDVTDGAIVRMSRKNAETNDSLDEESASVPIPVMNLLVTVMLYIEEYAVKREKYEKLNATREFRAGVVLSNPYFDEYTDAEYMDAVKALDAYIRLGAFIVRFGSRMRGLFESMEKQGDNPRFLLNELGGVLKAYAEVLK